MIKLYHFYYFNNMLYFKYIKRKEHKRMCKVKNMMNVNCKPDCRAGGRE